MVSLLVIFALLAFAASLVGGIFWGVGQTLGVLKEAWLAFQRGLSGDQAAPHQK